MRRLSPLLVGLALGAGSVLGLGLVQETPQTLAITGFGFEIETTVPGTPDRVFDLFTGDISPWWDHHFVEKPAKLYIEPRPGGGFYEIFNERGDGAMHAQVTIANRGKELVFRGPLGFGNMGVHLDFVHHVTFEPQGNGTRIVLTVHGAGEVKDGWPQTVQKVWEHFLIEQFKPYAEKKLG